MLKLVLKLNGISCAVFGLFFVFWSLETSMFLGNPPVLILQIVGCGLIINAGLLFATSMQSKPPRIIIMIFAYGDAAWVAATVVFLLFDIWVTTANGILCAIAVGVFVGGCGLLQWYHALKE